MEGVTEVTNIGDAEMQLTWEVPEFTLVPAELGRLKIDLHGPAAGILADALDARKKVEINADEYFVKQCVVDFSTGRHTFYLQQVGCVVSPPPS